MPKLIHEELTYLLRGVLFDVYNRLGPLLPEKYYQRAAVIGLEAKGVKCQPEKSFEVYYRDRQVGRYAVDVWIEDGKVVLEIKVAAAILPLHQGQAISYLKVTDADLAIVVNFGAASLETKRLPNFLREKQAVFTWEPRPLPEESLYPNLTNRVLEGLHRVHFTLGPGFLHQIYRRATMVELEHQELSFRYIKKLPIIYQNEIIGDQDVRLICVDEKLLVATVAVKAVEETMTARLKARLRHSDYQLGLLANFHDTQLQVMFVRR